MRRWWRRSRGGEGEEDERGTAHLDGVHHIGGPDAGGDEPLAVLLLQVQEQLHQRLGGDVNVKNKSKNINKRNLNYKYLGGEAGITVEYGVLGDPELEGVLPQVYTVVVRRRRGGEEEGRRRKRRTSTMLALLSRSSMASSTWLPQAARVRGDSKTSACMFT